MLSSFSGSHPCISPLWAGICLAREPLLSPNNGLEATIQNLSVSLAVSRIGCEFLEGQNSIIVPQNAGQHLTSGDLLVFLYLKT